MVGNNLIAVLYHGLQRMIDFSLCLPLCCLKDGEEIPVEIQFYNVSISNDSPPGGSGVGLINSGSSDGSNDSPPGGSGVG